MTIQECYKLLEGDYDDVITRLRSDKLVQKFMLKYLDDPSYDNLCKAMEAQDREEAFRAAHTIKGVGQNLGFTKLYQSASTLCEAIRNDWDPNAPALAAQVTADHQQVVAAIHKFQEEAPV